MPGGHVRRALIHATRRTVLDPDPRGAVTSFRYLIRTLVLAASLVCLVGSLLPPVHAASFRISPARYEFDLDGRYTDSFTITNTTDQTLRLRIYANFVAYDDSGNPQEVERHPFSLVPWLVIYPRRVSLAPLQKRVVRFTVRAPEDLAPGEYRGVVFFEELPGPPQESGANGTTTVAPTD